MNASLLPASVDVLQGHVADLLLVHVHLEVSVGQIQHWLVSALSIRSVMGLQS